MSEEQQGQEVEDVTSSRPEAAESAETGGAAEATGSAEERPEEEGTSDEAPGPGEQGAGAEQPSRLKRTAVGAAVGAAAGGAVVAGRDFLSAGGAEKVKDAASAVGEKAKEKLPRKTGAGEEEPSDTKQES